MTNIHPQRTGRWRVVTLIGAVLASSCAGDQPEPNTRVSSGYYSSNKRACELISPSALEGVLGFRYSSPRPVGPAPIAFPGVPTMNKCLYEPQEQTTLAATGLVYAYADLIFERTRKSRASLKSAQNVAGLGKRAFWDPQRAELYVLEQNKVLGIFTGPRKSFESNLELIERNKRLAKYAIKRFK